MTKRSVVTVVLLSIVTCGIYSLYWYYVTADELNQNETSEPALTNFIVAILLGMVTCGIYTIYWMYKFYTKMDKQLGTNNTILNLILCLFGLEIVAVALTQSEMNK